MNATISVPLEDIGTGARMRRLREATIVELAESIRESGLLHPIAVTPDGKGFQLVAGAHRLEAFRRLRVHDRIPALLLDIHNADSAALAEIDENLIRADLSAAETAAHHAKRKEIYERLHPETKHGGDRKSVQYTRSSGQIGHLKTYAADAAAKIGNSSRNVRRETQRGQIENVIELAGTSLDTGEELDALSRLSAEEQRTLTARAKAGEKVSAKTRAKQVTREAHERALAGKIRALPDKRYGVILADPEWRWEPWSRLTGLSRSADNHYPTSCLEVIKSRDVSSISAPDCVLFLWATGPMNPHALVVMAAWGFDYVSQYAWGKDKFGTGYWNREKHELLLIGTRGNVPCPAPGTQWESLIMAPRGRHSEKPDCVLEMLELYFPNVPKIELNRRGPPRQGWDAWGNEAELRDEAAE